MTGLFQLRPNIAFLMRVTYLNPIAVFIRFKYPEATLAAEDISELNAAFTLLIYLLKDPSAEFIKETQDTDN
jgi:hypothetical protein